jgi:SacI homology domain
LAFSCTQKNSHPKLADVCLSTKGLLTIASFSYLLCITRREQVAQIFGKSIYVIKDVAILPLSSQQEAEKAIIQARASLRKAKPPQESDGASSASEESEHEGFDEHSVGDPSESQIPANESHQTPGRSTTTTSVVQDVIERKGQYGRFASQWFSRRGWGLDNKRNEGMSTEIVPKTDQAGTDSQSKTAESSSSEDVSVSTSEAVPQHTATGEATSGQRPAHDAAVQMLPKILRTTRLLFTSRSYYFSYDIDVTKRFGSSSASSLKSVSPESAEQQVRASPGCSQASLMTI